MILSIVILSYNRLNLLLNCLGSIRKQFDSELKARDLEIIIVDNKSDGSVLENIEKKIRGVPGVSLIKNKENLGFSKGCNFGAKKAKGEFVLFLNSDTQIRDRGLIKMVNFLKQNQDAAVAGGRLLNSDESSQPSFGKFYNLANFFVMLFGGQRLGLIKGSSDKILKVDWVTGACFMVNKNIFNKLGGFDEKIFMYMEDMEYCYRAKMSGFSTYYYPSARIIHKEQGSSSRTFAVLNIYKGILYFYKKHKNNLEFQIVRSFLFLKAITVYLLGRLTNNSYYTNTYGQALGIFKE